MEKPRKNKCNSMIKGRCTSNMGLCSECHRNQAIDAMSTWLEGEVLTVEEIAEELWVISKRKRVGECPSLKLPD